MGLKIPNLDFIKSRDPLLGEAIEALVTHVENTAQKTSVNPQGNTVAPAPPTAIKVTTNASGIHRVSWTDNNPRTRNARYFHEWDTDPNFGNPQTTPTHVGRQVSIPISMGDKPVYHRVCAQYPDGPRSAWVYHGSPTNPTGVIDNAPTVGPAPHPTTGSGTSSTGGQGFGIEKFVSSPVAPGIAPKVFKE